MPKIQTIMGTNKPQRNSLCQCGSGKKYKKCYWIKEVERNQIMTEAKKAVEQSGPTQDQAIQMLVNYTNARVAQHNHNVTMLNDLIMCLKAMPQSDDQDMALKDMKRRLDELVGNGANRDTVVTQALSRLMWPHAQRQQVKTEAASPSVAPAAQPESDGLPVDSDAKPKDGEDPDDLIDDAPGDGGVDDLDDDDLDDLDDDDLVKV